MTVGTLVGQAFSEARARYQAINVAWVRISHLVGGRLPASLMSVSIQRDGELDLVLRCIEDELAPGLSQQRNDDLFVSHYLNMMSTYWIGSVYETFRLLRQRKLADQDERFTAILRDLELLRIPLEKHEIAKDRTLMEPLTFIRNPPRNDASDKYTYAPGDDKRAHIMPMGISARGSVMWQVTDLKIGGSRWVERRSVADQVLDLWREK